MITVSVVIATRNRRQMLSEAIATVRAQTLPGWEIIVVDDASTDDTPRFLARLQDAPVRVIRQAIPAERSNSRNLALAEARGEFVMFLDDDDLLRPEALEGLVQALRSHPEAVAASGACRIFQTNGASVKVYRPAKTHQRVIWRELVFGWYANSGQNLYRTAIARQAGGFDSAVIPREHWKMLLAVARLGPVCVIPLITMDYRRHPGQSRPPNVDAIRQSVLKEFIGSLPLSERRAGSRVLRAAELVQRSENDRAAGKFGAALRAQLKACMLAPYLLVSPLTGRPLWWGLKKCLLRVRAP